MYIQAELTKTAEKGHEKGINNIVLSILGEHLELTSDFMINDHDILTCIICISAVQLLQWVKE